ncbi:hypothetical protein, partial [Planktotalea frisia]|uniref:hypothetical protein n=1 Tax=Planktotalea frisia TaxID=696762 RepID=UPI002354ABB8
PSHQEEKSRSGPHRKTLNKTAIARFQFNGRCHRLCETKFRFVASEQTEVQSKKRFATLIYAFRNKSWSLCNSAGRMRS